MLDSLNPYQQQAVLARGHCLVTACPGSGKTRVLSVRAARLLEQYPGGKLLAVTFTRDAATSLRDRIIGQAGESSRLRVATGTLHSLALKQLQRAGQLKRLASPAEQALFIRRASEHTLEPITLEDAIGAIEHIKSCMEPPPPPHQNPGAEAYHLYQGYLDQAGMMDFADLLLLAVLSMRDGTVKPYGADWLLVDEAQDMDEVQMAWVEAHALSGVETMLVADDDQSIYGWRHAMGYKGLTLFRQNQKAELVTLPVNYRCDRLIIEAAARLIQYNQERVPKDVVGVASDPGKLQVLAFPDRVSEAEAVVQEAAKGASGIAVLARTNQLLDAVELNLAAQGIPYYRTGGKSLWDREAPATVLGLLQAITERSHAGLCTALHFAGTKVTAMDALMPKDNHDLYRRLLNAMGNPPEKAAKTGSMERERLIGLARLCREWEGLLRQGRTSLVIAGVAMWVRGHLQPQHIDHEVCDWLSQTLLRMQGKLIERLRILQRPRKRKTQEGVALMTLHSSKGLEWDRVWLIGVESGVLPHPDSPLEEERRLCYVGMTRARHELTISHKPGAPSVFLAEAGLGG